MRVATHSCGPEACLGQSFTNSINIQLLFIVAHMMLLIIYIGIIIIVTHMMLLVLLLLIWCY